MCHPQRLSPVSRYRQPQSPTTDKQRAARRIVKKYRKREEKKQFEKLRFLIKQEKQLPPDVETKMGKQQVIDETIGLIVSLEQQLMTKIMREGAVPPALIPVLGTHHPGGGVSLDCLRQAMAMLMPKPRSKF